MFFFVDRFFSEMPMLITPNTWPGTGVLVGPEPAVSLSFCKNVGPKLPVVLCAMYIYVYIYIYAVGSITWSYFGHFRVNNLAMVGSITWPSFFEPIKIGVWGDFLCTVFQGVVQN